MSFDSSPPKPPITAPLSLNDINLQSKEQFSNGYFRKDSARPLGSPSFGGKASKSQFVTFPSVGDRLTNFPSVSPGRMETPGLLSAVSPPGTPSFEIKASKSQFVTFPSVEDRLTNFSSIPPGRMETHASWDNQHPPTQQHAAPQTEKLQNESPSQTNKVRFVWTGFQGKTLWDWLGTILIPSMIPIILGIYAFLSTISTTTQQTAAMQWQTDQQLKGETLQNYTDTIRGLMLNEKLLQSKSGDNVRNVATRQTTLALSQLDGERKAYLLRFIYQLGLINIQDAIIDLNGANLTGANLAEADLRSANLTGANLAGADLRSANLTGANLHKTYLTEANLSHAILLNTDLSWSTLIRANMTGADMTGASLTEAKQTEAILPNGSRNP